MPVSKGPQSKPFSSIGRLRGKKRNGAKDDASTAWSKSEIFRELEELRQKHRKARRGHNDQLRHNLQCALVIAHKLHKDETSLAELCRRQKVRAQKGETAEARTVRAVISRLGDSRKAISRRTIAVVHLHYDLGVAPLQIAAELKRLGGVTAVAKTAAKAKKGEVKKSSGLRFVIPPKIKNKIASFRPGRSLRFTAQLGQDVVTMSAVKVLRDKVGKLKPKPEQHENW